MELRILTVLKMNSFVSLINIGNMNMWKLALFCMNHDFLEKKI